VKLQSCQYVAVTETLHLHNVPTSGLNYRSDISVIFACFICSIVTAVVDTTAAIKHVSWKF